MGTEPPSKDCDVYGYSMPIETSVNVTASVAQTASNMPPQTVIADPSTWEMIVEFIKSLF
jgi:hypothetical protein